MVRGCDLSLPPALCIFRFCLCFGLCSLTVVHSCSLSLIHSLSLARFLTVHLSLSFGRVRGRASNLSPFFNTDKGKRTAPLARGRALSVSVSGTATTTDVGHRSETLEPTSYLAKPPWPHLSQATAGSGLRARSLSKVHYCQLCSPVTTQQYCLAC